MAAKKRVPKPSQSPLHIPRTAPQPAARRDADKPWVLAGLDEDVGPAMLPDPTASPAPSGARIPHLLSSSSSEVPADPPPPDPFREKLEACTKAIAELASFLLSSTRPNRFSEASRVALLARQLAISTATRAKDLSLGNGAGLMAYPMAGGGGVVEGPIFAEEAHEPLVGARAAGGWAGVLGDNFQNPNDAGINQRDALLSLMTSMQAQGDQARANTRRALAGELEDLTRVRDQLAASLDLALTLERDPGRHPDAAQKVVTLRGRLETLDKRIARLFAQIEADPVEPAPAPAPAPAAAPVVAPLRVPPRAPAPFRPAGDFR